MVLLVCAFLASSKYQESALSVLRDQVGMEVNALQLVQVNHNGMVQNAAVFLVFTSFKIHAFLAIPIVSTTLHL
jgi:hypothetical protein